MTRLFNEIRGNYSALITLVDVNIKTSVAATRLGWLWWVMNPLITMAIYYFFVNIIMDRGGDDYHLFVLTGLVAWQSFSASLIGTTDVILNNKQLIRQVAFPLSVLIAIPVLVQLFFNSIGIVIILMLNYSAAGVHSLTVIPLLVLIGLIVYGLGLFLSVINVYVRDLKHIMAYVLRAGFFLSPILFPASRVMESTRIPEFVKTIFSLNPMAWIITALRSVLLDGNVFGWQNFFVVLVISLFIIQVGLFWLRTFSSQIIKML